MDLQDVIALALVVGAVAYIVRLALTSRNSCSRCRCSGKPNLPDQECSKRVG